MGTSPSLSYLQKLPVDTVKIDRSFIVELDGASSSGISFVRAIIDLAHSLKLRVIAEGVDTPAKVETLAALGCDVVQGYLLHRPAEPAVVAEFLAGQTVTALPCHA